MSKSTEYSCLRTIQQECTVDDFRQIVKTTVQQAKDGSHEARLFLAAYMIGAPKNSGLTLSGLEVAEAMSAESDELLASLYPKRKTRR